MMCSCKKAILFLEIIVLSVVGMMFLTNTVSATEYSENAFPEGIIVIPQGTDIVIDDDAGTVTIINCQENISEGTTFVVYLQDLPIAYVADSVTGGIGEDVVIAVHKAEESVYSMLDETGDVALTPAMYEFIPAAGVEYSIDMEENDVRAASDDPFELDKNMEYKDGVLRMSYGMGDMSVEVTISNLHLSHSISDGNNIGVTLNGNWGITTTQGASQDPLSELPLGEMRIGGIGKVGISISFEMGMDMTCNMAGTFSAGIGMSQDGEGTANRGFVVTEKSVKGEGSITAALKITAGVDVLVASADLFVKIAAETKYTQKDTYHKTHDDPEEGYWVHCDDFTVYLYACVGAEASYYNILLGKMTPIVSKTVAGADEETTPYKINIHLEEGKLVDSCTQGMVVDDPTFPSFDASYTGSGMLDLNNRILESDVSLPWDMEIDQDFTMLGGSLDLNGHTLTVKGDFIQAGGTLTVGGGTLSIMQKMRFMLAEIS